MRFRGCAPRVTLLFCSVTLLEVAARTSPGQSDLTNARRSFARADSVVALTPGAHYRRSAALEFLLGGHYRELWATEIHVPVLNMHSFAGGLTPILEHGGSQTTSLRLAGADGRTYQ